MAGCAHAQAPTSAPPSSIPPEQRQAFEQLIREYLLSNPQVLLEAQQALHARQEAERAERARKALVEQREALEKDPASPVAGNPRGDITVVEFFDYACGYCKRAAPALEALKRTDANVRVIYKEFPILGPNSVVAARAALAAQRQGKYEEMHRALMQADGVDEAGVRKAAASVGLDLARMEKDMAAPEIEEALRKNQQLAAALDIGGTPAFVVGSRLVPGAVDEHGLRSLVEMERQQGKKQQ